MKDCNFTIYNELFVYLGGEIKNGSLEITSEVFGDENYPDSEKHYIFSESQTEKLFSLINLEDFIGSCRSGRLLWLERFLREHGITPREWVY